ncbi:MAG: purine-binding chemotaxis protein CheW [Fibrobacteria bacterium]|nr:purine-binding chemotaxis protein CheW [Fibrobacteria bacterium]
MAASTLQSTGTSEIELTVFTVGDLVCAMENLRVREISAMRPLTKVHHAPAAVRGVVNLRGQIMTVIDLGERFGTGEVPIDRRTRILVVPWGEEDVGLVVDSVEDVMAARVSEIEPTPSNISGVSGKFFRGILKSENDLVAIVDVDALLDFEG